ncbi:hypothetical protein FRC02_010075 [Tulasnella sp. 418]|nr:hypothetical protein FRC02_010075 [Tulasnella sp. 418]
MHINAYRDIQHQQSPNLVQKKMVSQKLTPLTAAAILAYTGYVNAAVPLWGQCGGIGYTGETVCVAGAQCNKYNDWYSQCIPGPTSIRSSTSVRSSSSSIIRTTSSSTRTTTTTTSTRTTTTPSSTSTGLRGLHKLASAKGRYFGTATDNIWNNNDAAYKAITGNVNEFGVVTPANAQKWDAIEPTQNNFAYTNADATVTWAQGNQQVLRGHTFVWHSQLANWVTNGNFNAAQLTAVIENHIANVGAHYKGKLYAWDVVNEAFNEDGTYRTSVFYTTLGADYIPLSLKAARAADPSAKLYLNDYNGHLIVGSVPTTIPANIKRFTDLKLEVAVTELDIRLTLPATAALLAQQAKDYVTVVNACLAHALCVGVQTWDTSDDYSWIPSVFSGQGAALLFDDNKVPKPAYYAVADALAAATVSGPGGPWV